jgi:hypothetical protein
MTSIRLASLLILSGFAFLGAPRASSAASERPELTVKVEAAARTLATELARACPAAEPDDKAAFDSCRATLFRHSMLKQSLNDYVLWGRQRDPGMALKDAKLTQFGPDVLAGMYLPLFMFNGEHTVRYVPKEDLYQIRLRTAFRNRLQPGQFPYPFWHEAEKWTMYENANEVILWWDASAERIKVAQFTVFGEQPAIRASVHHVQPAFDGKWLWTDADGRTQPTVTVFDGLFRSDNPYLGKLETAYKTLALRLREGQCMQCHVPNNPDGMKRLVLLQTPMHAAAEIKRLMKSVRDDRMPRDEFGIENPLDPRTKAALLNEGAAFEQVLDEARDWEAAATPALPGRTSRPQ